MERAKVENKYKKKNKNQSFKKCKLLRIKQYVK